MATRSITGRLILGLTAGTTLFWCIAAIGSSYVFNEELNETFDLALRETAQRLLPLAIDDVSERDNHLPRALARSLLGSVDYLNYQIADADGHVLLRTPDAIETPADLYDGAPRRGFRTIGEYRTYSETDGNSGITLTVAETTSHRQEAIGDSTRTLFWPLLLLLPLSAGGIWLAVRGALRPVHRLRAEIAARDGNNLTTIDASDQPAELKPIAESISRLIERLRAVLDAERAFAANSAHELRTPIAGALAQTQRLLAELDAGTGRNRALEIELSLKRLASLSEKLLQISRVDAGIGLSETELDLLPVLELVVRDARAGLDAPERLRFEHAEETPLLAHMDMDAFAIAMRNLIDNAIKHGDPAGPIEVGVAAGRTVFVRNAGPTIPPGDLAALKQRFARGPSAATGSGLGLAIVEAVMRQAGGTLALFSPPAGRSSGFEARLTLGG